MMGVNSFTDHFELIVREFVSPAHLRVVPCNMQGLLRLMCQVSRSGHVGGFPMDLAFSRRFGHPPRGVGKDEEAAAAN
jgi:hypothetical protein